MRTPRCLVVLAAMLTLVVATAAADAASFGPIAQFFRVDGDMGADPASGNWLLGNRHDLGHFELRDGAGALLATFGTPGTGPGQISPYRPADDVAVDPVDGSLYVADGKLEKFTAGGDFVTERDVTHNSAGHSENASSIAVDPTTRDVYVTTSYPHLQKYGPDLSFIKQTGANGSTPGKFAGRTRVAVDPASGEVFVTDASNHRVQVFSSSLVYERQFGSLGTGDGQFQAPAGIAFDHSGDVYVSDNGQQPDETGHDRIERFHPDGTFVSKFGHWGRAPNGTTPLGLFYGPDDLTVDGFDNLYILDNGNDRTVKYGVRAAPAGVGFGSVPVGSTVTRRITVADPALSTVSLQLGTVSLSGGGGQFAVTADGCSGHVLAPGRSCAISVVFTPSATGRQVATLAVPTNDPPSDVKLSGVGT